LNPGPHGPESHDFPSGSVDFCLLQFDSSDSAALIVQIGVNLQRDYYMKYYTDAPRSAHRGLTRSAPMSRPSSADHGDDSSRPRMSRIGAVTGVGLNDDDVKRVAGHK